MDAFLDKFFFGFHSILIVFSLFGWIWKKTRLANLIVLSMIAFSWFVLGIWYGLGFCPSTQWHWQIRMKLGHDDMPESYIKFLVDSLSGFAVSATLVDTITVILFVAAFFFSVIANGRGWKKTKSLG
jgi:hypothetical protein